MNQNPILLKPQVSIPERKNLNNKFSSTPPPVSKISENKLKFMNPRLVDMVYQSQIVDDKYMMKPPTKSKTFQDMTEKKSFSLDFINKSAIEQSRQLQETYEKGTLQKKNALFKDEILKDGPEHIVQLALDKYQHYLLEKVLEVGPLGHKQWIFEAIYQYREQLWFQKYAQKIFGKCIEISKYESQSHYQFYVDYIIKNKEILKQMRINPQGNQILQKCIEIFDDENALLLLVDLNQHIIPDENNQLIQNTKACQDIFDIELCQNQFGCLLVNKIIEMQQFREGKVSHMVNMHQIVNRIISKSIYLSERNYSNYVIQQILLKGLEEQKQTLIQKYMMKSFIGVATNKYGSNVAEKVVEQSSPEQLFSLWKTTISNNFEKLVNDSYANYVMQTLFRVIKDDPEMVQIKIPFCEAVMQMEKNKSLLQNGQIVLRLVMQDKQDQLKRFNSQQAPQIFSSSMFSFPTLSQQKAQSQQYNPLYHSDQIWSRR